MKEQARCLVCGEPAVANVGRSELRQGVKRQYFPSSKHRQVPMCRLCCLLHVEGPEEDGPARFILGHNFVPGRLEEGAVATAEPEPEKVTPCEEFLQRMEREGVSVLFDATRSQLFLTGGNAEAATFAKENRRFLLMALAVRATRAA